MPVSNQKKIQTLINAVAEEAQKIKEANTRLQALRTLYTASNVDATGTLLQGNVTAVSNWIDSVNTVANSAVPNGMIAAYVPSHRGKALE